jgi:erythromycin esterase
LEIPGKYRAAGFHLTKSLGSRYYPIGFTFLSGGFRASGPNEAGDSHTLQDWTVEEAKAGSFDSLMNRVGRPNFFLDISRAPAPLKQWLDKARPTRGIGSSYEPAKADMYYENLQIGKVFSGMIFLKNITPAQAPQK